jgi:hypothetical protein
MDERRVEERESMVGDGFVGSGLDRCCCLFLWMSDVSVRDEFGEMSSF